MCKTIYWYVTVSSKGLILCSIHNESSKIKHFNFIYELRSIKENFINFKNNIVLRKNAY